MQIRKDVSFRSVQTSANPVSTARHRTARPKSFSWRKAVTATAAGLAALQRPVHAHPVGCGHGVKAPSNVYVSDATGPAVLFYNATRGGEATTRIPVNASTVGGLGFSPDGQRLYANLGHQFPVVSLGIIDTNPKSATFNTVVNDVPLGNGTTSFPAGVIVAPSGNITYVGTGFDIVAVDVEPGSATYHQVLTSIRIGTALKQQPAFTPDGLELWWPTDGAERNPTSSLVRLNTDPSSPSYHTFTYQVLPLNESADAVSMNPSAPRAYVTGNVGDTVLVYETANGTQTGSIAGGNFGVQHGGPTGLSGNAIAGRERHRLYAVTGTPPGLFVYNTQNDAFLSQTVFSNVTSFSAYVSLSTNDTQAYITDPLENILRVVDVHSDTPTLSNVVPLGANSQPGFLTVQPGPARIVQGLHDRVAAISAQGTLCERDIHSLKKSIGQAAEALKRNCAASANHALKRFLLDVQRLQGQGLNDALATELSNAANYLLTLTA